MFQLSPLGSSPHNLAQFPSLLLCWQVTSSCFEALVLLEPRSAIEQELHSMRKVTQWGSWMRDDTPFFQSTQDSSVLALVWGGRRQGEIKHSVRTGLEQVSRCTRNPLKFGRVSANSRMWCWWRKHLSAARATTSAEASVQCVKSPSAGFQMAVLLFC